MTFEQFADRLIAGLGLSMPIDPQCPGNTQLFGDDGLDSFHAFELLILIETMAKLELPPTELPVIFTLGDAYAYYLEARSLAGAGPV
jgi:acyl carrier protein